MLNSGGGELITMCRLQHQVRCDVIYNIKRDIRYQSYDPKSSGHIAGHSASKRISETRPA